MLRKLNLPLIGGFLAVVAVLFSLNLFVDQAAQAAPPAIPTPVSVNYSNDKISTPIQFFANDTVLTQTTNSPSFVLGEAELLDIHYSIDQTDVNTMTITLQFSNDGTNWVNGLPVLTANAADAADLRQFQNFGYRTRVNVALSNTNPVTFTTFRAMARR